VTDQRLRGHREPLSSSRTDLTLEAREGFDLASQKRQRSTRDRWLLLGLLICALGIGIGVGIGMSFGRDAPATVAAPAPECAVHSKYAPPAASHSTATHPELAHSAAAPPNDKVPSSEGASSALLAAPCAVTTSPPTPKRRSTRPRNAPAARRARAPALAPDLHEALRLLRAAQQALRAADATRALSLLEEMARRTPDALVDEREVTRALAHCAANDVDSARRTAAALRESGASRVYAHRLSESCVGPEPTPASLLDEMRQRALN
jgi:hypothetical protein